MVVRTDLSQPQSVVNGVLRASWRDHLGTEHAFVSHSRVVSLL